jgi:uncharacterized membrane protein
MIDAALYVILGVILLMVPGFLLSTVLYPRVDRFDFWTRMGASLGLGTMLAVIVGFSIAMPGISALSLVPFVEVTAVLCIAFAVLTYLRGGFKVVSAYRDGFLRIVRPKGPPKHEETVKAEEMPKPPETKPEETPQP